MSNNASTPLNAEEPVDDQIGATQFLAPHFEQVGI